MVIIMKLLVKLLNKITDWIYKLSLKSYDLEKKCALKRIKSITNTSYELRNVIMKIEKEKTELENTYNK